MQIDDIEAALWRLGSADGHVIAPHLRLLADGRIRGHDHANERSWRLHDQALVFDGEEGLPSTTLYPVGSGRFEGPLHGQSEFVLTLERTDVTYPLTVVWNEHCDRVLADIPIFVRHYRQTWGSFQKGQLVHFARPTFAERDSSMPTGQLWSMGAHSYVDGFFDGSATVGRYCSIARGCGLMGDQHPTTWITTHHSAYQKRFETEARELYGREYVVAKHDPQPRLPITIEHDVWIGQDVLFKGGITIGNGAIVAARAVVTRDVPPYTIVGGVPAKPIRRRFADDVIDRIERVCWWNYNYPDLPRNWDEPVAFLDELEWRIAAGTIEPFCPPRIDLGAVLLEASLRP